MRRSDPVLLDGAAGAFGLLSLFWTLFSLFAVYDFLGDIRGGRPQLDSVLMDMVVWGLHILFVWCTWYSHRRGKLDRSCQPAEEPPHDERTWPPPPRRPQ